MKKYVNFILLVLFYQAAKTQTCFSPVTNYTLGSGPISIISEDFNLDGNNDLAVDVQNTSNISILFGSPSGAFSTPTNYPTGGAAPVSVCSGLFNGDSYIDLAVVNNGSANIRILYGSATGTFSPGALYGIGAASPFQVIRADFNNDSYMDLATPNYNSNNVSILLGSSTGTFSSPFLISVSTQPSGIYAADFNSDGNMDFVTTNSGSNNLSIRLGTGTGTIFSTPPNIVVGSTPRSVYGGDFNSDGNLDLVCTNYLGSSVSVLLGGGNGSFALPVNFATSPNPISVRTADFNGDCKLDLAVSCVSLVAGNVSILLGTGTGSFSIPTNFSVGPYNIEVCCKDFNNDGKPDFATACADPPYVASVRFNQNLLISCVSPTICSGNSASLIAAGVSSYTWSNGAFTSSISPSPSVNTVYSVSGTNSLGCISPARTVTVIVNNSPTVSVNSSTICFGNFALLTASGATSYSWSNGPGTSSIVVSPTTSTSYSVIGGFTNNCANTATAMVLVNPLPAVSILSTGSIICAGTSATLTATGANTYLWNNSTTNSIIVVSPMIFTNYTIIGTAATGCSNSAVQSISVNPTPTLSVSGKTLSCANKPLTIGASGAATYSWNTGVVSATLVVTPTITSTYTVVGTSSINCTSSAFITVNTPVIPTPSICLVTVDSLGINNEIYWDKNQFSGVDTFIVLRETNSNIYTPIARIRKNTTNSYADTNRTSGYNSSGYFTGNPNFSYYNYKLQMRDTCGNLSGLSQSHTSIKINDQQNSNFNWNEYKINGVPLPSASYSLWRQNISTGTSTLVGATPGIFASDGLYNSLAQTGNVKWFITTAGFPCSANLAAKGGKAAGAAPNRTKSNNTNERQFPVGIQMRMFDPTAITLFPNPANRSVNIRLNSNAKELEYKLSDVSGRVISQQGLDPKGQEIDLQGLPAGLYFINIYQESTFISSKKLIVEH